MRILLIEPSLYTTSGLRKDTAYRDSFRAATTVHLALPYIAALMPPDTDVKIAYDVCEDIEENYDLASFDLVGVTCTRHVGQIRRSEELGRKLRELGVQSVIGGPVTIQDNHRMVPQLSRSFDAVVIGEAEPLLPQVLEDARQRRLQKVYRCDHYVPLEGLPVPRFDLVNFDLITPPHVFPAMTARGCPRACDFCSEFLYSPWRYRPVDEVIEELKVYKSEFGAEKLVFRDDDFLVHPKRSRELLTKLIPLGFEWTCQTDLNLARHMDVAELAVEAGLKAVDFGLESVEQTNRSSMGKNFFGMAEVGRLLRMLNEHRVEIQINIIFGLDDDTPDVFDSTLNFLLENRVSTIYANILIPEPGTTLYKRLQSEGRLLHALRRADEIEDATNISYIPKHLTPEQLVDGTRRVRERFEAERGDVPFWLGPEKTEY